MKPSGVLTLKEPITTMTDSGILKYIECIKKSICTYLYHSYYGDIVIVHIEDSFHEFPGFHLHSIISSMGSFMRGSNISSTCVLLFVPWVPL